MLVGEVFPSSRAGFPTGSVDDGWRAVLLVTGDIDDVLNDYIAQAREIGLVPRPSCSTSPPELFACFAVDDYHDRGIELYLQRGHSQNVPMPLSHLFIRYRRSGHPPERTDVVALDDTYGVDDVWRDVPDDWPPLPGEGHRYEALLTVPDGTELVAPPAFPLTGSVAVFRVTGDPSEVIQAATPRNAALRRVLTRRQEGAQIRTGYASSPSPTGTVNVEVVERPGRPTYLMVEHDATD
jgi:hypothetical protein